MTSGKFITFEGGEGCGKSTQAERLKAALESTGREVVLTREPGGTWISEEVRRLLKDPDSEAPSDRCELLLFLAARAQLVEKVIKPALARGAWVISDRFSDSTIAYQGFGRGLPIDVIRIVDSFACGGVKPDLTILLCADRSAAASRMRSRESETNTSPDRIELAGDGFHERIREGYLKLASEEPGRIVPVDANGTVDEVWERVWKSIRRIG